MLERWERGRRWGRKESRKQEKKGERERKEKGEGKIANEKGEERSTRN